MPVPQSEHVAESDVTFTIDDDHTHTLAGGSYIAARLNLKDDFDREAASALLRARSQSHGVITNVNRNANTMTIRGWYLQPGEESLTVDTATERMDRFDTSFDEVVLSEVGKPGDWVFFEPADVGPESPNVEKIWVSERLTRAMDEFMTASIEDLPEKYQKRLAESADTES